MKSLLGQGQGAEQSGMALRKSLEKLWRVEGWEGKPPLHPTRQDVGERADSQRGASLGTRPLWSAKSAAMG